MSIETTMTPEQQPFRATLTAEDVFARAGVTLPDEPEERDAYFNLVEAAATMASEQLVDRVAAAETAAHRANNECAELRQKVREFTVQTKRVMAASAAKQKAAVDAARATKAQLDAVLSGRAAQQAEQEAQSSALTMDDLSFLVGQRTEQPES